MKTKITIITVLISLFAVTVSFFSCSVALGSKLDVYGPILEITAPSQRKSVQFKFALEGTIGDFSGVDRMVVKASRTEGEFSRQWRWYRGAWEVSNNSGVSWVPYTGNGVLEPVWDGTDMAAVWLVPIDMAIDGAANNGEYTFSVQSWDIVGNSDDNSYRAVILIIDQDPPKVDVSTPYLYRDGYVDGVKTPAYELVPLSTYQTWADDSEKWKDPAYLGEFLAQDFELKWQIDDTNDLWSFDLRFYEWDVDIDNDPLTPLPEETVIYQYHENVGLPPSSIDPGQLIKPNGTVIIPDLNSSTGTYGTSGDKKYEGGQIVNQVTEKKTIKVVTACYDAAGNLNQEKTIGYFVFWPLANTPWIVFNEGLTPPKVTGAANPGDNYNYYGQTEIDVTSKIFKIYPGRTIKATAYQAQGVEKVTYSLFNLPLTGDPVKLGAEGSDTVVTGEEYENVTKSNIPYSNGVYPRIFPWEFKVPPITGYYLIRAEAWSSENKASELYTMLFQVQDITFPDFPSATMPPASEPLFKYIGKKPGNNPAGDPPNYVASTGNTITISGVVSDATDIKSLCLAWINPQSEGWAAMSQLAYFREKDYPGWQDALKIATVGGSVTEVANPTAYPGYEYPYDVNAPNRLWKVKVENKRLDTETHRYLYDYSQEINLNQLNIGTLPGQQPLKSQVFLLRAENPNGKCTIVTYAPQGDVKGPSIVISAVTIKRTGRPDIVCRPAVFNQVPEFADGDTVILEGTGEEDSVAYLDIDTYFKPNFEVTVNNTKLSNTTLLLTQDPAPNRHKGTWTIQATVGGGANQIPLERLRDTLVVSIKAKDIGGNETEIGSSWLIETDFIKLMRISSEKSDGTYNVGTTGTMEIFLEFSKPVKLRFGGTPELILSSNTGTTARAAYKTGQTAQNSRQYFVYTIAAGQNALDPNFLNVKSLWANNAEIAANAAFNTANYPFTWYAGDGQSYEEVRITRQTSQPATLNGVTNPNAGKIWDGALSTLQGSTTPVTQPTPSITKQYYVRTLPTTTDQSNSDYQFTLASGKHLVIDTTAPTPTTISSNTAQGYYNAGDIYFTITFSEDVKLGATRPSFPLTIGGATRWTSNAETDVRVNGNKITFRYIIQNGDTITTNDAVRVGTTAYTGQITDIVGNALPATGTGSVANLGNTARTLTGVYVETVAPGAPTVRVLTANNVANILSQYVNGTGAANNITGESGTVVKNLSNVYNTNLWLAIQGNTTGDVTPAYKVSSLEYTINAANANPTWVAWGNTANTPVALSQTGTYQIAARQKDKAGNVSAATSAVNFTWDPGTLISRISSQDANGTYTAATGRNKITIDVYFRKNLFVSGSPTITTNVVNASNANIGAIAGTLPGAASNKLSFTYTVTDGHRTPTAADLIVSALNVATVWDGTATGNGVRVDNITPSLFTLPSPALDVNKKFTVATGSLTNTAPTFAADSNPTPQGNENFHGIMTDSDGSYWTTLEIPFTTNGDISKGSGAITIQQIAGTGTTAYRMPAVMTEAQYNRFKSNTNTSGVVDTYYIKGTNGFNYNGSMANAASDTTNKYILLYQYDPNSANPTSTVTGNTAIPAGVFTNFRNAEKIELNVNSSVVSISGKTLKIRLTGSSAPQVPGASYEVTYPAGIINDTLGNTSAAGNYTGTNAIALRGVAKPFVRIKKTQDTISVDANPSITNPRFVAAQPFLANARMDCRTPGSAITYTATTDGATNVTGVADGTATNNNNWSYNGNPTDSPTPSGTRPGTPATGYTNSNELTFGYTTGTTSPTIANVQGFRWWARARASVSGTNSVETEEMAYRTVISYQLRNRENAITASGYRSILAAGDQIWIRGGDAVSTSSIPGFPFTWEDDWDDLANNRKRAGIRLMTKVSQKNATDGINCSTWRFVTWDMNATAYVDFIRGREAAETVDNITYAISATNVVWQYGPKRWAYQCDGWTALKERYPIYAGKHRWCDAGYDQNPPHQMINFSGTFMARPDKTASYTRWPGINTQ
jgi:hypothetical protein